VNAKSVLICVAGLLFGGAVSGPALSETPGSRIEIKPVMCRSGPVERTISNVKWAIYSCDDGKTILAAHRNAWSNKVSTITAMPIDDRVVVKAHGALEEPEVPTFAALKAMTPAQLEELVAQTKSARHGRPEPAGAHDLPEFHPQRASASPAP
jgi:hypothetical protein